MFQACRAADGDLTVLHDDVAMEHEHIEVSARRVNRADLEKEIKIRIIEGEVEEIGEGVAGRLVRENDRPEVMLVGVP